MIDADGSVSRIDPDNNRLVQTVLDVNVSAIASGADGTWAVENIRATGSIAQLAPHAGAVWVTDPHSGLLWRIDPAPVPVERTIQLAAGASDVAYDADAVWVANGFNAAVSRVDPQTNQVTQTVAVGDTPGRLTADDSGVGVRSGPVSRRWPVARTARLRPSTPRRSGCSESADERRDHIRPTPTPGSSTRS
jgi:YVTN family beta-propeller protein